MANPFLKAAYDVGMQTALNEAGIKTAMDPRMMQQPQQQGTNWAPYAAGAAGLGGLGLAAYMAQQRGEREGAEGLMEQLMAGASGYGRDISGGVENAAGSAKQRLSEMLAQYQQPEAAGP